MASSSPNQGRLLRRHWELGILVVALLMSLACVFVSTWLALRLRSEKLISANMLPTRQADYGQGVDDSSVFAPLTPGVGAEAATDVARLARTPELIGVTPVRIVFLPPTPTATLTSTPSPTSLPVATSFPKLEASPTQAATQPPTPTSPPTPISTSTSPPTSTRIPTATPVPTVTSTSSPIPTVTHTPVPPTAVPTDTPVPTSPPSPTDTPTREPTPTVRQPRPRVLAVSPNQAANNVAVNLVITGTKFVDSPSVFLVEGGETLLPTTYISPTLLNALVPAWFVPGFYDLKVTNPDSKSRTLSGAFTLTHPVPLITGVSPDNAQDNADTDLTINGSYFVSGLSVSMDSFPLLDVTIVDSATLTATVPSSTSVMPGGVYTVTISNPGPLTPTGSLAEAFTITLSATNGDPPTCEGTDICDNASGPPDGIEANIATGGAITFTLPPGSGIRNGPGYDFVYFEYPNGPGILLDWVVVEISEEGNDWCTVFNWGGGGLDTNTNIEPPYGSDADGEVDNEVIPSSDLWPRPGGAFPSTGIAIDINISLCNPLPGSQYRYVRISNPYPGDPAQVDAIQRLH